MCWMVVFSVRVHFYFLFGFAQFLIIIILGITNRIIIIVFADRETISFDASLVT
jgi:hypothetical protein